MGKSLSRLVPESIVRRSLLVAMVNDADLKK